MPETKPTYEFKYQFSYSGDSAQREATVPFLLGCDGLAQRIRQNWMPELGFGKVASGEVERSKSQTRVLDTISRKASIMSRIAEDLVTPEGIDLDKELVSVEAELREKIKDLSGMDLVTLLGDQDKLVELTRLMHGTTGENLPKLNVDQIGDKDLKIIGLALKHQVLMGIKVGNDGDLSPATAGNYRFLADQATDLLFRINDKVEDNFGEPTANELKMFPKLRQSIDSGDLAVAVYNNSQDCDGARAIEKTISAKYHTYRDVFGRLNAGSSTLGNVKNLGLGEDEVDQVLEWASKSNPKSEQIKPWFGRGEMRVEIHNAGEVSRKFGGKKMIKITIPVVGKQSYDETNQKFTQLNNCYMYFIASPQVASELENYGRKSKDDPRSLARVAAYLVGESCGKWGDFVYGCRPNIKSVILQSK